MTKQEIKQIADNIVGVDCTIEENLNREYYIYLNVWYIDIEQLNRISERINILAISVDTGRLMLTIKP